MHDWTQIIKRGFESKELDYKAPCSWDESNKRACCELVKDILALSNTNGGWLVIGVNETASGFAYDGVTQDQAATFDTTRLNRFLQNYTDPPINTHVHKPKLDTVTYVVVEVPRFVDTPHICQKDYPSVLHTCAIYIRSDSNESSELKKSVDVRNIVEKAIRNRTDVLLESFRAILKHGVGPEIPSDDKKYEEQISVIEKRCDELDTFKEKKYGYREVIMYPTSFNALRFNISTLREMAKYASVDFRGWPFLFFSDTRNETHAINDGYETCLSGKSFFGEGDEFHFWQLKQTGLLYTKDILFEDELGNKGRERKILDFDGFSMSAAEAIACLTRLYEGKIDDSEEITLIFRLKGMAGRAIGSLNSRRGMAVLPPRYFSNIDDITYLTKKPLIEWKAGLIDYALEICKYVFERFNWHDADISESNKLILNMLERKL